MHSVLANLCGHVPILIYGGMTPIQDALRKGWTPERIEGRLTVGFPDDPRMRASHECLYQ